MKKHSVENALRCMLAAWMLLATASASSTFAHSHFDGDRPHGHEQFDCVPADLPQLPRPGDDQGGHRGSLSLSDADFHQHWYLLLFGVEYQPVPSELGSSREKSPCGWETIIAVSTAQGKRASSIGVGVDYLQLTSLANRFVDCVCQPGQHEIPAIGDAPTAPLCDRARHERSGVQLA
jgi:hypothetical protein